MSFLTRLFRKQGQAAAPPAAPSCDSLYGDYIQKQTGFTSASSNLKICNTSDPTKYPMNMSLQPVITPAQQRYNTAQPLQAQFNSQLTLYTSLVASTKAFIAAAQPLQTYKSILESQLNGATTTNQNIQKQIATNTDIVNQVSVAVPQLSHIGPFGAKDLKTGVGYSFLVTYSLFFILVAIVLYIRFSQTGSKAVLIICLLIMLVAAAAGAYFFAISTDYGLGLANPQAYITDVTNNIKTDLNNLGNTIKTDATKVGNTIKNVVT